MFDFLFSYLFPLVVLATWSNSDIKNGTIHNLALIIPIFLLAFWNPWKFQTIFIPSFAGLILIFSVLHGKNLFGFADVLGIPFALSFLPIMNPFAMITFSVFFSYLLYKQSKKYYDEILKTNIQGRIILMPVLFLSFFAAIVVHLITLPLV